MENRIKVIIEELFNEIKSHNHSLNERYIHHYFTKRIQEQIPINFDNLSYGLHPEWPTYKKSTNLNYGKYRFNKIIKKYELDVNGSPGFIDFCIGTYNKPNIAIEFFHKYGWSSEDVIFDFMKLLDKLNPYKISFSVIIISRDKFISSENNALIIEQRINKCLKQAKNRLGDNYDNTKKFYFYVIEHGKENNKRKWYYDNTMLNCERIRET